MSEYTNEQLETYIVNAIGYGWYSHTRPDDVEVVDGLELVRIDTDSDLPPARAAARRVMEVLDGLGVLA